MTWEEIEEKYCPLEIDKGWFNIVEPIFEYIENGKLSGKPFVDFYTTNQAQSFNSKIYTYPNYDNEEDVKIALEKNNIFFSAKQGKDNTRWKRSYRMV